jgi:hypothetical protein
MNAAFMRLERGELRGLPRKSRTGRGGCCATQLPISCRNKLGDVAVAAGDLAAARTAYQASLGIAERLAARDPENT